MSQWDPIPARYLPQTYAMDVLQLLDALGLDTAVFIGTSLGGLVTMAVAAVQPQRIAAALLNDAGPELGAAGFERIRTYAGKPAVFRDWDDAVDLFRARHRNMHPTYGPAEWLAFAKRLCRETESGIEFDYDMAIAEPLNDAGAGVVADAWPFYRALAGRPVLVLRGEHSDLLPIEVVERMSREIPDVDVVTIPGVGHAPDLDEPQAVEAIDRLLLRTLATRRA
jgi:pimeloyl-ACP methyl ester carboxylesterase